jgi:hypothetical protein
MLFEFRAPAIVESGVVLNVEPGQGRFDPRFVGHYKVYHRESGEHFDTGREGQCRAMVLRFDDSGNEFGVTPACDDVFQTRRMRGKKRIKRSDDEDRGAVAECFDQLMSPLDFRSCVQGFSPMTSSAC